MLDTSSLTGRYVIDPAHSRVGFTARHAMVTKVRGHFTDFESRAVLDSENPGRCHVEVAIKAASIETGNAQRDGHLRTNDFLNVERYPLITFESTSVTLVNEDTFRVTGPLTIKGVAHDVTIDFLLTGSATDPFGNSRVGFEGSTTINRRQWGVEWNAPLEAGGVLVSEAIRLDFDISAIKVAAPDSAQD